MYYTEVSAPSPLARHFVAEACNNAWANHRLLKACCQLTDAEFAAYCANEAHLRAHELAELGLSEKEIWP